MELSVSTLGVLVLLVIVAIAIIIFLISGVGSQTQAFNETHNIIIGNLSGIIE